MTDAWSDADARAMLEFVNKVLARRELAPVADLRDDLSSGVVLISVVEILSGKAPTRSVLPLPSTPVFACVRASCGAWRHAWSFFVGSRTLRHSLAAFVP